MLSVWFGTTGALSTDQGIIDWSYPQEGNLAVFLWATEILDALSTRSGHEIYDGGSGSIAWRCLPQLRGARLGCLSNVCRKAGVAATNRKSNGSRRIFAPETQV